VEGAEEEAHIPPKEEEEEGVVARAARQSHLNREN
jgi:hypothetical protein